MNPIPPPATSHSHSLSNPATSRTSHGNPGTAVGRRQVQDLSYWLQVIRERRQRLQTELQRLESKVTQHSQPQSSLASLDAWFVRLN